MRCVEQSIYGLGARLIFTIPVILILGLTALPSHAATVRVPADQPTIQAGVDAANESDTVLLAPGTYTGPGNYDILLDGKGLVVRSESGPAITIIDCESNGGGFAIGGPMASQPVIEGLTITNAYGDYRAGGLSAADCSPIIDNCIFVHNVGGRGGGIHVNDGFPSITNCVFGGNTAPRWGGAISLWYHDDLPRDIQILNCTFVGNFGDRSIYWHQGPLNTTLRNCVITANSESLFSVTPGSSPEPGSITFECCNVQGNDPYQWYDDPRNVDMDPTIEEQAQLFGNFSQPPLFCDLESDFYSVHAASPLLAENNSCGVNIGAQIAVGCSDCRDDDEDGLCATDDNCPQVSNLSQLDADFDGIGDACEDEDGDGILSPVDNCVLANNIHQEDVDLDGIGDACDDDIDGDGVPNESDNCPVNYNPGQEDHDTDGRGDVCCCIERVGDANGIGGDEPTIGDVSVMIDAKYITGTCEGLLDCLQEADLNQSGGCTPTCDDITIGDIAHLIMYLYVNPPSGPYAPDCLDCP